MWIRRFLFRYLAIACFLFILCGSAVVAEALTCTGGSESHLANAADIAAGKPAGSQVCPDALSADSGSAKQYLNTIWCGGRAKQCGGNVSNVEQLDPKFAVCIAKFIQQVKQKDPSICMYWAYRSGALQQCICGSGGTGCLPAGQSNHQKGIAIDVRARNYSWLHSEIEKFGGIRHLTITNIDPNHIEAIQGSAQCGTPGYQPSDPSSVANTPTSDIANAIRNVLGMNTQSPASPPPPPPAQASQPQPLPPSAQPTLAPAPVTDQTLPINPAPVALPAGSVQVGSNAPDHMPTSTFDLIDQYVNPPNSAPDVATSAPVHLNQNIGDTATGLVPAPSGTESTGMAATQGPPAQQTFTSSDLAQSALPARNGFLGRWLDTLQGTLWYALNYLKPFRGVSPLQHVE